MRFSVGLRKVLGDLMVGDEINWKVDIVEREGSSGGKLGRLG